MSAFGPSDSPLDRTGDAVGEAAAEAFGLLGNETRLAVLIALWEAFEPFADGCTLSFTELQDRVGYDASGNFSYHLERLEGHFVASTEAGYRLTRAGHGFVRSVVAGAGIDDRTVDPTDVDAACTACGGQLAVLYRHERVYTICRDCEGRFEADDEHPPGTVMWFRFDPAGLSERTPEEIFAATVLRAMGKFTMQMGGVCPACSGRVDASIDVCSDHEPDGVCSNCGRTDEIQGRWVCRICKNAGHGPPGANLVLHPRVVAFYARRGLYVGYDATDFDDVVRTLEAMAGHEQELVSTDPTRIRVSVRFEGDELRLVVDEEMSVVDVEERLGS